MPMTLTDNPNIELEQLAYNLPYTQVAAKVDELESYDQFINFSDPPKTPEEIANEFGSPLEPNYIEENYNKEIDGIAFSDPNDLEPPIHFYGRTEEDAMQALFEDSQTETDNPKSESDNDDGSEASDNDSAGAKEAADANTPPGEQSGEETPHASNENPNQPADATNPAPPVQDGETGEKAAPPATPAQEVTAINGEITPNEETDNVSNNPDASGSEKPEEPSDETHKEETPQDKENPPATPPTDAGAVVTENLTQTVVKEGKQEEKTVPPAVNVTPPEAKPAEKAQAEPTAKQTEPQVKKEPTGASSQPELLCPRCGKKLYRTQVGTDILLVHSPKDSKFCQAMYNSIEDIQEEIQKMKANKEKLNRMILRKRQEKLEQDKLTAGNNQVSQGSKTSYGNIFSKEPANTSANNTNQPVAQQIIQTYDPEILRLLNTNIGQVLKDQGTLQKTVEKEIDDIQKQQDKILEVQASLTQEIGSIKETIGKIDVNGANQKLEELTQAVSSTMQDMEQMKKLSTVLGEQSENLTQGVTDMLSATRNAGEMFSIYSNSVRKLQATDVRLRTMIPYLEKYLEDTDERYEGMINRYGEVQQKLGENFKVETEKFFKEAKSKINNQLNLSAGGGPGYIGYILSFVAAFLLMMVFNIMK